ncbi:MAG TPA: FtsX-like permease family protein, partial [Terriglobales bacterium]|nr:FtsX-like permease family protein [Terriglobales bacterium]
EKEPTRIVLVSQALARKYWPNENPVGKTILIGPGLGPAFDQGPVQIIGVVGDMRERLDDDWLGTIMYQLPAQIPDRAMTLIQTLQPSAILVRTRPGFAPMSVSETVKQTMLKVGNVPATNVRTMEQVALDSTAQKNFNLALLGLFAALAVLLAGVGIYGVMSYSVEQRTHEIGIRAALGATPLDTLKLVLGQALRMSTIGVAAGIIAALGLMRVIASQLFHVKPTDPLTFVMVPIILVAIALAGAFIPALRAIRTDPMAASRQE